MIFLTDTKKERINFLIRRKTSEKRCLININIDHKFLWGLLILIAVSAVGSAVTTIIGENIVTNDLNITGTAIVTGNITATGTVESTSGGIKFPDGTIQTTRGVMQVGSLSPEYLYPEDLGKNWSAGVIVGSSGIKSLAYAGNGIVIAGDEYGNIYRSTDYGVTWSNGSSVNSEVDSVLYVGNGIVLVSDGQYHINRSTDYGITWNNNVTAGSVMMYAGNGIILASNDFNSKIYRSTDYGVTWNDGIAVGTIITSMVYVGNGIVLAGDGNNGKIYFSDIAYKLDENLNLPNAHIPADVTATRAFDTIYQNTGTQAKMISVTISANTTLADILVNIQGFIGAANPPATLVGQAGMGDTGPSRYEYHQMTMVVPAGYYYKVTKNIDVGANASLITWQEIPL